MLTSVAMAQETQPDTPPANIELLLPASSDNNPVNSQPSRNEHDASLAPDTPESSANTSANGADDATQPEGSNPSQETPGATDANPSDDGVTLRMASRTMMPRTIHKTAFRIVMLAAAICMTVLMPLTRTVRMPRKMKMKMSRRSLTKQHRPPTPSPISILPPPAIP